MENRFNLIDEPWIPVTDVGRVSLRQIFSNATFRSLGGNPTQKIAMMKLLLAIAQAAVTPEDEQEWRALSSDGLAQRCLKYLERWHDRFYLYGPKPFLQMPAIVSAKVQSYGAVVTEVSTGNTTVLSQFQLERSNSDADKALILVSLSSLALSGKKTDNSVTLTPGYRGKLNDGGRPSSSRPGPGTGYLGFMHSFLFAQTLQTSIWLNLLTKTQLSQSNIFPQGVGVAVWEQMPEGEDCPTAKLLKQSLQGRLLPLCRFCLLSEQGLHYSEGLAHSGYKEGVVDPSVAVNYSGKDPKALWVDPEKRPWRELTSLLGFIDQTSTQGFQSLQIRSGLDRACDVTEVFAIWSGGLRVSSNAGEQFVSGSDDFVESLVWLHSRMLGQIWFALLKAETSALDDLAKNLYGRVMSYFKEQTVDGSKFAAQATHRFWQLCERSFQELVDGCEPDEVGQSQRRRLRQTFATYVNQAYDYFCPNQTARQLDSWAKCKPNTSKYLREG